MQPMRCEEVVQKLSQWLGQQIFVHLEVNRGAYWRNGRALLKAVHVRGDGPFRLFLELDDAGLIQADDLTHMEIVEKLVICTAYDEHHRLARTVEVSTEPFQS